MPSNAPSSASEDGTIKLWNAARHTEVWSVAFLPDGHTLASGNKDDTIKLWDVSNVNVASK
jgi:WD40 repeat protein